MILREVEVAYKPGKRVEGTRKIHSALDAYRMLKGMDLHIKTQENFVVLHLNTRHEVVSVQTIGVGGLNEVGVHPREVFRAAIMVGAAAIILAHNHPSGDASPSREDLALTLRMCDVGKLLGITVLDHVVVGDYSYSSMKECDLM